MSNGWRHKYTELIHFVSEHPEIEIEESRVKIPESVRPEFYRLFNIIRTAFIEEKFADLLNEAKTLSAEYTRIEADVTKFLELEEVSLEPALRRFLDNAIDELAKGLFEPLFDLLKGNVDIQSFEQKASSSIEASFRDLYRLGYERWVAVSLIKLLEADKLFQVTPREFYSTYDELFTGVSTTKEDVPIPRESSRLSFDHQLRTTLIAPSFIVSSTKVNGYIALRLKIGEALTEATDISKAREWYSLDYIAVSTSGLMLIYLADKPEEISLIGDLKRFCRPDLIIVCEGNKDWYREERINKIKMQHNILKPLLGTYAISRETVPDWVFKTLALEEFIALTSGGKESNQDDTRQAGIHILTVGFDQSRLLPIVSVMMNNRRGKKNEN